MIERPILFSGPMVQAILAGKKTQTRRVIAKLYDGAWCLDPDDPEDIWDLLEACPYGQPGDRLWVRETWTHQGADVQRQLMAEGKIPIRCLYRANPEDEKAIGKTFKWSPSIFMPRWASRLTLEIKGLRIEHVNQIDESDAIAEGMTLTPGLLHKPFSAPANAPMLPYTHRDCFEAIWDSLNEKRGFGWDKNPWVWVIAFRLVTA